MLWIGSVEPANRIAGDLFFLADAVPVLFDPLTLSPAMWFDSQTHALG